MTRAVFIGRYSPFHKGHLAIMQQKIDEGVPILILVRDTDFDIYSAKERERMINAAMLKIGADAEVMIIPDIESVNYGRGVGYGINELEVPENIKAISATDIRTRMANDDDSWREFMPEGTHEVIEEIGPK
ncbi:hypothetical protein GOV10_03100 [Candidatus Woesearchaeota archaeon]|nr:hypothetical protein [Candidatus Woesearchaeota archaeon]